MNLELQILSAPLLLALVCLVLRSGANVGQFISGSFWIYLCFVIYSLRDLLFTADSQLLPAPGFLIDRMSAAFLVLTAFISACALTHAKEFFACEYRGTQPPDDRSVRLFYMFCALFVASMMAVFTCDNLGYLWIGIEATTLLSAGLVYYGRTKHAIEATWKYLIICSVGIALALLGTIFIFAASQHGAFAEGSLNLSELTQQAAKLEPTLLKLGFIFALVGYGTKAGLFPLHSWLPDAHSEAPAPASAMLSGALLNCALFAIWKILQLCTGLKDDRFCHEMVLWAGTITTAAASLFLVRQHGLKRLWAYSSIENVGLMLVAIGLGSGPLFVLQAINHSVAKVSAFLLSGNIIQLVGSKELTDIKGVARLAPIWAGLFALSALAVVGVPPFGSFISEWLLLVQSVEQVHWAIAVILLLSLSLCFIAVCSHAGKVLLGTPKPTAGDLKGRTLVPALLVTLSLVLGLVVGPDLLRMVL